MTDVLGFLPEIWKNSSGFQWVFFAPAGSSPVLCIHLGSESVIGTGSSSYFSLLSRLLFLFFVFFFSLCVSFCLSKKYIEFTNLTKFCYCVY